MYGYSDQQYCVTDVSSISILNTHTHSILLSKTFLLRRGSFF